MNTQQAMRLALVVAPFYAEIVNGLKTGALLELSERGLNIGDDDVFVAPGAFEVPLFAKKLAQTDRFDGVICLGCVIKGETAHFEYISQATADGLMQAGLDTEVPISFGILTSYTKDQAEARAKNDAHNKGREAAAACVESVLGLRAIDERFG